MKRRSVALGWGRPQERRLLAACREDPRLRVAARCSSAPEILAAIEAGAVDVMLLDEDLHLLDDDQLRHLKSSGVPTVALVREPAAEQWQQWSSLTVLSMQAEACDVLVAILDARAGRTHVQARPTAEQLPSSAAAP